MVGDVHVLSQPSSHLSEVQEQSCAFEVGDAFRIRALSSAAVQTRNEIINATSHYLGKLYKAGHVTESSVVNFFNKISADQIRK